MQCNQFYIDGAWVDPVSVETQPVVNPANESAICKVSLGNQEDVDRAVKAARKAFQTFQHASAQERSRLLEQILAEYRNRYDDIAQAMTLEMGAPIWLSKRAQAATGVAHLEQAIASLRDYQFQSLHGTTMIREEAIGVCALITPWNWPINQLMAKLAPALAAGCTIVLKPSEVAPLSAQILAEVIHKAGLPKGVFNLVHGDGPTVGQALAAHPDVDAVSFTGSTRAGILIAQTAAKTVKRVHQELGGKSANIILEDANLERSVTSGVRGCLLNSGQSCNAPTRMLIHASQYDKAVEIAKSAAEAIVVGDPMDPAVRMGPLANAKQYGTVSAMIKTGLSEGARLVCGGEGYPDGISSGYFVKPTIFADVSPAMTIAREEIFGPVLSMLRYETEAEAIAIANDSPYGLAGYVSSGDLDRARNVAAQLRAGTVYLNDAGPDFTAPFGGYKQSGNGREWGIWGMKEFLEVKAIPGFAAK